MSLTGDDVVKIIMALGGFATVLAGLVANLMATWRASEKAAERGSQLKEKLVEVGNAANIIHGHVNGASEKMKQHVEAQRSEIELLKQIIIDKDRDKALLAQTAALAASRSAQFRSTDLAAPAAPLAPSAPLPSAVTEAGVDEVIVKLSKIDDNTKAIADHTAPHGEHKP